MHILEPAICDQLLPKPAMFAHNVKEWVSLPIDSCINKLTICHNTTAKS